MKSSLGSAGVSLFIMPVDARVARILPIEQVVAVGDRRRRRRALMSIAQRAGVGAVAELQRLVRVGLVVGDLLGQRLDRRVRAEVRVVAVDVALCCSVAAGQRRARGATAIVGALDHDRAGGLERVERELGRACPSVERAVVADALAAATKFRSSADM